MLEHGKDDLCITCSHNHICKFREEYQQIRANIKKETNKLGCIGVRFECSHYVEAKNQIKGNDLYKLAVDTVEKPDSTGNTTGQAPKIARSITSAEDNGYATGQIPKEKFISMPNNIIGV